ncbi:MAG: hypothetical protein GYB42_04320 [Alphaproteobacteria bacterium]|nr:hypothetical protein [Alphaproteobacteria bacterium]
MTPQSSPGFVNWWPKWFSLQSPQTQPVVSQQAALERPAATFIVRFQGEPVLDDICKTFRRDEAGARAKFETWQQDHPAMQGLVLMRASYSGEIIVGLSRDDALKRTPGQVLEDLRGMDNLVYAETDEIAQPGGGN